jgi:hypothetical protein
MAATPQIKTFEVRGQKYRTTLLPASTGRAFYLRLMKAFGAGLAGLGDTKGNKFQAGLGFVAGAIAGLDSVLLDDLCEAFGAVTYALRTGGEDSLKGDGFDNHFTGRYDLLTDWLVEIIKLNGMISFLSEILSVLGDKTAGATKPIA